VKALSFLTDTGLKCMLEIRLDRIDRLESGDLYSGMRGWCGHTDESYRIEHDQLEREINAIKAEMAKRDS
jgi:hypothetical protein